MAKGIEFNKLQSRIKYNSNAAELLWQEVSIDSRANGWMDGWTCVYVSLWTFDTGDQNLKQEGRFGFEEPFVESLSVLGRGKRELVFVSRRKHLRTGKDDAPQSISVHSHHSFLQSWWEFPGSDRPGEFVEFGIARGREIFEAPRLFGGRKGLAPNRHLNSDFGSLLYFCLALSFPVFPVLNPRRKLFVGNVQVVTGRSLDLLDLSQSLRLTRSVSVDRKSL